MNMEVKERKRPNVSERRLQRLEDRCSESIMGALIDVVLVLHKRVDTLEQGQPEREEVAVG